MKIFHFGWEKHQWQKVVSQRLDSPSHFLNASNCFGLYYITGAHFVYGQNTLLYIGMAQEQKFGYRLNQHDDFDITNIPKIEYLYVGRLIERDDGTPENWNSAIDISEKMLINTHLPAMNSSGVKWILDEGRYGDILVCNWGDIGIILPEISGFRFSSKYWDKDKYPAKYMQE